MTAADIYQYYPPRPGNGGNLDVVGFNFGKDPSEWLWEPKVAGERIIIHVPTGTVFNRHGKRYSRAHKIRQAVDRICNLVDPFMAEWVDCEAMTCKGNLDDVVVVLDAFVGNRPMEDRREFLGKLFRPLPFSGAKPGCAYLIPQHPWTTVRRGWNKLKGDPTMYEGVVAKLRGSLYAPNYESATVETTAWRKHRND